MFEAQAEFLPFPLNRSDPEGTRRCEASAGKELGAPFLSNLLGEQQVGRRAGPPPRDP
ncbi:hypothetical protein M3027_18610 [Geoalkalibacter halelectricus]|nr:hypothetical protein [Geoalkalibacter halelectricus]